MTYRFPVRLALDFATNACDGRGSRLTLDQSIGHVHRVYIGCGEPIDDFRAEVTTAYDALADRGFAKPRH